MAKRFDATMRRLIELDPAAWLRFLHIRVAWAQDVRVIDSNISTVTAEGDKVLFVDEPEPWIEQIELQAGRDPKLVDRMHLYSPILGYNHNVPVDTTVILLRPAADGPEMTGTLRKRNRRRAVYDRFYYNVVRIWERPVEELLSAGLPILSLAPVSDVDPERRPGVLTAISKRLVRETVPEHAKTIWAATRVLMGLRYSKEQVDDFTKGISAMILGIRGIEESSVYQDIFAKGEAKGEAKGRTEGEAKGRADEARETLVRLGRRKFGPLRAKMRARLNALDDVDDLHRLLERILDVTTWKELLISPSSRT